MVCYDLMWVDVELDIHYELKEEAGKSQYVTSKTAALNPERSEQTRKSKGQVREADPTTHHET
ncbi:MAG: hypothetical protein LQ349_006380 [Xanthoria aureola]|nr:MAG: hypothetical protein LQ349_006380 [Xanthoria aureola]